MNRISYTMAFIDGQNLQRGTKNDPDGAWVLDLRKFRIFLREKHNARVAYYFIGAYIEKYEDLYNLIRDCGYELVFREQDVNMKTVKKGNVDTDIVFYIMDWIYRQRAEGRVVLVSGDGDYKRMVAQLIEDGKFEKIIFPSRNWSSLYYSIGTKFREKLYTRELKKYLARRQKR